MREAADGFVGTEDVGELEGDEAGDVVGEGVVAEDGGEVGGVGGHFFEAVEEVFAGLPFGEGAAAVVGEVLMVDGGAVEGGAEEGLDFGEGV